MRKCVGKGLVCIGDARGLKDECKGNASGLNGSCLLMGRITGEGEGCQ